MRLPHLILQGQRDSQSGDEGSDDTKRSERKRKEVTTILHNMLALGAATVFVQGHMNMQWPAIPVCINSAGVSMSKFAHAEERQ